MNKKRKAKGSAIVLLTTIEASTIKMIPISPPNMRKQRIIIAFKTCRILSTFISFTIVGDVVII